MEEDSCRICLNNDILKLSSIFSSENSKSYAELVTFSCGIQVNFYYCLTFKKLKSSFL